MDRGPLDTNGNDISVAIDNGKDELEEEEERETVSLLPQSLNGGIAERENKKPKRKVQWKDRHGNKLVQVLEFYPSDSSDSEDEEENGGCCCTCSVIDSSDSEDEEENGGCCCTCTIM